MTKPRFEITRRSFIRTAGILGMGVAFGSGVLGCATPGSQPQKDTPVPAGGTEKEPISSGKDTILIGHHAELSGGLALSGYWRRKTVDAAAQYINESGGIAGRPVQVVTVDTETNTDVGNRRLRKLIDEDKVDFIVGAEHGGIAIASAKVAEESQILYLPTSRSDPLTLSAEVANRYVYRVVSGTVGPAKAVAGWFTQNVGKKWAIIYSDYAWGQSHRDSWTQAVRDNGGTVSAAIGIPINTADHIPYIQQIPQDVDAIQIALIPPDLPRIFPVIAQSGLGDKQRYIADGSLVLFDVYSLGDLAEGIWYSDQVPWVLADQDTPHMRNMYEKVGVDVNGREIGSGHYAAMGDVWIAWEIMGFIKTIVEGSGWKTKADTLKLIEWAEAHPNFPESDLFPQGELHVRPEDHQGFARHHVLQVKSNAIRVQNTVDMQATVYPAAVNLQA